MTSKKAYQGNHGNAAKDTVADNKKKGDHSEVLVEEGQVTLTNNYESQKEFSTAGGTCRPDYVVYSKDGESIKAVIEVKSGTYGEKSEHYRQARALIHLAHQEGCHLVWKTPSGTDKLFTDRMKQYIKEVMKECQAKYGHSVRQLYARIPTHQHVMDLREKAANRQQSVDANSRSNDSEQKPKLPNANSSKPASKPAATPASMRHSQNGAVVPPKPGSASKGPAAVPSSAPSTSVINTPNANAGKPAPKPAATPASMRHSQNGAVVPPKPGSASKGPAAVPYSAPSASVINTPQNMPGSGMSSV
jgi:hypothetical protein